MTALMNQPVPVDQLRDRISAALSAAAHQCDGNCGLSERECYDAHPITWSAMVAGTTHIDGSTTAVADMVVGVLKVEMETAWQDWYQRGSTLRTCVIPGCMRQFDLMATWTGQEPDRESRSGKGWLQCRGADGYACPDHAPVLWGDDKAHVPQWGYVTPGAPVGSDALLRCSCGWDAGKTRFRGHGTVLWQAHALEVLEASR